MKKKIGKNIETIITRIMPSIDDNLAVPAGGAMNYREDSPYIGRKKGPAIAIQIQLVPKMEINSEFPHSPPPRNKHTFHSSMVTS